MTEPEVEGEESPASTRLLNVVTENWTLKVAALLVSLALYVVLHGGGEQVRTLEVDLIRGPDKDPTKVLLTTIPPRVHVTVQGPRSLIDDLANPLDALSLDLNNQPTLIRLEDLSIKLPPGVRKVSINPSALILRWDTRISKRLKVDATWSANPENLVVRPGSVTVTPATVMLTGPKSRIDPIQGLKSQTVELKDRPVGSHIQSVYVDLAAAGLIDGNVNVDPESVEVRFELVNETKARTFANVPVLLLKGKGVTIRPAKVSVVVTCPPKKADELKEDAIVPKIDLEALGADFAKKGPEETDVKVDVPGCSEVVVSPPRVAISR
jgi:YbbR domain-containing protein